MLEYACIFTKGGALLWTWSLVSGSGLRGNPVDALIRTCLLEDRSGESSFTYTPPSGSPYSLKWTMHNVSAPLPSPTKHFVRGCAARLYHFHDAIGPADRHTA